MVFLAVVTVSYGLSFIRTLTFVPYKTSNSTLTSYQTSELVALPDDFFLLKRKFPNIKNISDNRLARPSGDSSSLKQPYRPSLIHLKIKGQSFYDSAMGTFQFKWLRLKDDGYNHFLKAV